MNRLLELPLRHRALFLLALAALVTLPALGSRDLWYPDEPDIGEVAQAMYQSGDWITPRRMGEIWIDYPPMVYWTSTAFSHLLGGMSEFSLRLPSALSAIGIVLLTSLAASRWFDRRTGLWAGLALLTFPQFAYEAINYRPDLLFAFFITAGLLLYASAFGERVRWGPRIGGFALLGLAILSKGPLGLLLPGLVITLWHGARREWRRIFELAPLTLVALAVALPWYTACAFAMGPEVMLDELWGQNLGRFTGASAGVGPDRGHVQPNTYYLVKIFADMFPWTLLLPSAVWWLIRTGRWRDRWVQLGLWWFGAIFVFLSLAVTKRQVYLLPAYSAAALLLAPWLARVGRSDVEGLPPNGRHARLVGAVFAAVMAVGGLAAIVAAAAGEHLVARLELDAIEAEAFFALRWPLVALGALMLPAALWLGVAWRRGRTRWMLRGVAATSVGLWLLGGVVLLPALNPARSYSAAGAWISDRLTDGQPFGLVDGPPPRRHGFRKRGGFAYYTGHPLELLAGRQEIRQFFRRHPTSLVVVHEGLTGEALGLDESLWRSRVLGEFYAGRYRYFALQAPPRLLTRPGGGPVR